MEPILAHERHEIIPEHDQVHEWRVGRLELLGVSRPMAEAAADSVDWHQIAALVRRGCPPYLALRIAG